jgi:ABC-type transport system involved in cytochrome c biogenesis permease component
MEINIKKTFSIWIVIGIMILYGLYLVYNVLSSHSLFSLLPLVLTFVSIIGLFFNKDWSRYSVLGLALLISLFWIYTVITFSSKVFVSESMGYIIISLIPGVLMLALCFGCTAIVFMYFKKLKKP